VRRTAFASAVLALALIAPVASAPAAPVHGSTKHLKNCGTINFSGRTTKILVIRRTSCKTAKRVARSYAKFKTPKGWACALSHGNARYRGHRYGFSCGSGPPASGDIKKRRHAFIGAF
jgi:hypothetical protein